MKDETKQIFSPSDIAISISDEDPSSPSPQKPTQSLIDEDPSSSSPPPTKSFLVSDIRNILQTSWDEPRILLESAGKEACCIFRIPHSLAKGNPEAYKPKVVSIGPYHYGEKHLQMIQEHKFRLLQDFVNRAKDEKVLYTAIYDLQKEIRVSYSEKLKIDEDELVSMMILDGCFILMLFLIVSRKIELVQTEDPILTIPWILASIQSDLLLLENQVPLIVLQTLFHKSEIDINGDLNRMAFSFFNLSIDQPERYWVKHRNREAKHLLDLSRLTFIPNMKSMGESRGGSKTTSSDVKKKKKTTSSLDFQLYKGKSRKIPSSDSTSPLILSAKRLRVQGIKFRLRRDADSILDIRLMKNSLQIPQLRLDGFISSIFLNCIAFEQFYKCSNDITSYVVFMGCLLNDQEDVTFLNHDKRIIENYFGNENEVSQFFKTISKDVVFDMHQSYLQDVFDGVNEYTSKWYSGLWSGFMHTHFESPWTFLSSSAVVAVILLTVTQVAYAALSYYHDIKKDRNAAPP